MTKKILGIGNALVDVLMQIDNENLLTELQFPKGSMQLIDSNMNQEISQKTTGISKQMASGGSAANTIHGLARLGVSTGFLGKVGEDETGIFFGNDMKNSGINPLLLKSKTETGKANAFITKDSERTFGTFLGAAVELSEQDLDESLFRGYDILHVEGYLVQNQPLLTKAFELARANDMEISLDLASYNIVEANLEYLQQNVEKYVDIVFANEEEAKAFTGKTPEEALHQIAKMCKIAVVKVGSRGSMVKVNDKVYNVPANKANPIDTTGAGDLYAAGFLYAYTKNLSFEKAAQIGSLLGGKVIEVLGPKMDDELWKSIKDEISLITKS